MSAGPAGRAARASRSRAEWVSFAMASAVLLAIACAIGFLWARPSRPPDLRVTMVEEPRISGSLTYVTAEVKNHGTETAEEVQVVAEISEDGEPVPAGEQVVTVLAGGASAKVVFVIDESPPLRGLSLRVESYLEP